ncbi:MAG: phenylalanine--tRNA ligase subunit beta, partial [Thermoleophilia bacterium]|nr:phenylalanine--tRNA ligase subunit beta [Thermoleophilia bacterium]
MSAGTVDVYQPVERQRVIRLRPARIAHVLGTAVPTAEAQTILTRLGCEVEDQGGDLRVTVPTFRADLEREIDLIEEVARIHGLDRLPSTIPARRVGRGGLNQVQQALRRVEDLMVGAGLAQVITYSFADEKWCDRLRLAPADQRRNAVRITNPLSADQALLRTMLLPGLLE